MAIQPSQTPVLTNPYLWVLVLVTTGFGVMILGLASGAGIFVGGVIGVLVLAVVARLHDELRTPQYDNKIDPWND